MIIWVTMIVGPFLVTGCATPDSYRQTVPRQAAMKQPTDPPVVTAPDPSPAIAAPAALAGQQVAQPVPPPAANASRTRTNSMSQGRTTTPPASGGGGLDRAEVDPDLRLIRDARVPLERRRERIRALAADAGNGGAAATRKLMAIGSDATYLNWAAVRALGSVSGRGVTAYLRGRLGDPDPRIVSAAVAALAETLGADAIPEIARVLQENHRRDDGYQDIVCEACVAALQATGSVDAVPILGAELRDAVGSNGLNQEYGSSVVAALRALGHSSARQALEAYAERLATDRKKQAGHPMGRRYLDGKLEEVRDAISALANEGAQ